MHNIIRFYYQNKYKIWGIIIAVVLLIVSIYIINGIISKQNEININKVNTNDNNLTTNRNTQIVSNQSSVTGSNIDEDKLDTVNNLIDEFISKCNNGNVEEAYNLISKECKEIYYQDIEKFKTFYYDKIFNDNIKKTAIVENWVYDTYKVNITNDIMSTGNVSDKGIQDYITIVSENNTNKLNLNNYIGREELNINQTIENIKFNVIKKDIYLDYEIYTIQVENKTENSIILDKLESPDSIYLENNNKMKFYSYSNELIGTTLKINKGFSTKLDIKFGRTYSSSRTEINSIVFSNVILNSNLPESVEEAIYINL